MKRNTVLFIGGSLITMLPLSLALAQQANSVESLGAITVNAKRFQELAPAYEGEHLATGGNVGLLGNLDNMETPFSTINYTSTYIKDLQGQELRILISKNDPSVQTPGAGGTGGKDRMYIRGFSAGDVSLNGVQGLTSGRRVMAMAERLEVFKGPTAMLNGMNASDDVGGSINLVTKTATSTPISTVTTSYMNPSQFSAHVDLGRRFGEDEAFGIRVNAVYKDGEGMVKHRKNTDRFVSVAADYNKGPLRFKADLYHLDEKLTGLNRGLNFAPSLRKNPLPPAPKGDKLLTAKWAGGRTPESTAMFRAEYDVNDQLTTYASVGHHRYSLDNYNNKGSQLLNNEGDVRLSVTRRWQKGHNNAANIGSHHQFQTGAVKHKLSFSADWLRTSIRTSNTSNRHWSEDFNIYEENFPSKPYFPKDPLRPATIQTYKSIGVADTLSFMDDTYSLVLGLRKQWVNQHNKMQNSRYKSDRITPAIAGVWRLNQDWMVYANYIEGLTKGETVGSDYVNDGEVLPPQRTKQHEFGFKYDSGDYAVTASYFEITKPNKYDEILSDTESRLSYSGKLRNRGIELQAIGQLNDGFRLTGGVAYLSPKVVKANNPEHNGKYATNLAYWVAPLSNGTGNPRTFLASATMRF